MSNNQYTLKNIKSSVIIVEGISYEYDIYANEKYCKAVIKEPEDIVVYDCDIESLESRLYIAISDIQNYIEYKKKLDN